MQRSSLWKQVHMVKDIEQTGLPVEKLTKRVNTESDTGWNEMAHQQKDQNIKYGY